MRAILLAGLVLLNGLLGVTALTVDATSDSDVDSAWLWLPEEDDSDEESS